MEKYTGVRVEKAAKELQGTTAAQERSGLEAEFELLKGNGPGGKPQHQGIKQLEAAAANKASGSLRVGATDSKKTSGPLLRDAKGVLSGEGRSQPHPASNIPMALPAKPGDSIPPPQPAAHTER